jgi:hemerythrin-like domain-containing protein
MSTAASDLLRMDHRLVEVEIDRLLRALKHRTRDMVTEVKQALSEISRLTEPHFKKEEEVLFPYLRSQCSQLLADLDEQHQHAREIERHLVEVLASADHPPNKRHEEELAQFGAELCDVIQHHIVTEEDELLRLVEPAGFGKQHRISCTLVARSA